MPEVGQGAFTTDLPLTFRWAVVSDSRVTGYVLSVANADTGASATLKTIGDGAQRDTQIIDASEVSATALNLLQNSSKVTFTIRATNAAGAAGGVSNSVTFLRPVVVVETGGDDVFSDTRGDDTLDLGGDDDEDIDEDNLDLDDDGR